MKNKRVLAALLTASCLAASFTACSGDTSSSITAESSAASADASSSAAEGSSESTGLMSDEEIIKKASSENKVGTGVSATSTKFRLCFQNTVCLQIISQWTSQWIR